MSFLTIAPDDSKLYPNPTPFKLWVTDEIDGDIGYSRKKVKTYHDNGKSSYVHFDSGKAGYTYTVKLLFRSKQDRWTARGMTKSHWFWIQKFFKENTNISVVSESGGIVNGIYTITGIKNHKLIRKDYYEAEVEFSAYTKVTYKLTNVCTILQSKLKTCKKINGKVYTVNQIKKKKAKSSLCIGWVNEMLYAKGFYTFNKPKDISGRSVIKMSEIIKYDKELKAYKNRKQVYNKYRNYWTKYSKNSLIKFQKAWNKKGLSPKLNQKGNVDKNTWKAILRYTEL